MNRKLYGVLALIPLLVGFLFVVLSQKEIYQKLPAQAYLTSFTKKSYEYLSSRFPFRLGLDLSSGVRLVYKADTTSVSKENKAESLEVLRDVIERRVNAFGVAEPLVQIESSLSGDDRLLVELPGLTNVEQAIKLIGETPTLEFKLERPDGPEKDKILAAQKAYNQAVASGTTPILTADLLQDPYFTSIGLDGKYLKKSKLEFDQLGSPVVALEWDEKGTEIFASTTAASIGKRIGIYLDGQLISAPVVQTAIKDGKAQISGGYSNTPEGKNEAKLLAQRLNAGALPVSISIEGSEVVEPVLGAEALAAGLKASIYGLLFIVLMLVLWYRVPGVVGVASLLSYVVLTLTIFKLIPVTLSAAAIAGFVISMGMAVDGNILTFERLKEELNSSKQLKDALEEAFGRAWTSIRDSNIASFIVAVILFFVGTSVVKGFALTLGIGVIVSVFTNTILTRWMLRAIVPSRSTNNIKSLFKSPF